MIGAVVGVQPFGGHGLSGTGPQGGGPLYVLRLLAQRPSMSVAAGELPGPVGERNTYGERPKGTILCIAHDAAERAVQHAAAKAMGNRVTDDPAAPASSPHCSPEVRKVSARSTSAWRRATARSCPSTSPPIPSSSWAPRSPSASTPPPPAAMPA
jgi:delta 1-pyrroline-5-carboxylate dehydrogenase